MHLMKESIYVYLMAILIDCIEKDEQRNMNEIKTIIESTFNYNFNDPLSSTESNLNSSINHGNLYLSCISLINAIIDNDTTV